MDQKIEQNLGKVSTVFLVTAPCLILIHCAFLALKFNTDISYFYGFDYHFSLDNEYNIPAVYSTALIIYNAILLYFIFQKTKTEKNRYYWLALAIILFFLAIDELISLHELTGHPLRNKFDLVGYFYYSWVVVGVALIAIVFSAFLPFLRHLPPALAKQFLLAGLIYVSGAVGMEMIGGNASYLAGYEFGWRNQNPNYLMIVTLEETLEISGMLYFNYVLLSHWKSLH